MVVHSLSSKSQRLFKENAGLRFAEVKQSVSVLQYVNQKIWFEILSAA